MKRATRSHHILTKSLHLAGLQCLKRLWFEVKEPEEGGAPESAREALLERGRRVGEAARRRVPGGAWIEGGDRATRVAATRAALAGGAKLLYEASFEVDGVFVAVDLLERRRGGWGLVEVKAALDVKEEHLDDVAVQLHVLRRSGLEVRRVEVMYLARGCRFPRLERLFMRADVTAEAERRARRVGRALGRARRALEGARPTVEVGPHCYAPRECPFLARCHAPVRAEDLGLLYRSTPKKRATLARRGFTTLRHLPGETEAAEALALTPVQRRQVASLRRDGTVVEVGLASVLATLREPVAYLDFETVAPPIPAWRGCRPYEPVAVQWSCHVRDGRTLRHHAHLAEPGEDPRAPLALSLLEATRGTRTVLAYNAAFEAARLRDLARAVPEHARELRALARQLVDLLSLVREHVYHPGFLGSFSIKRVLPALVPDLGYGNLEIQDGSTASALLERYLGLATPLPHAERTRLGRALLAYCARDTEAMLRLHERLVALAGAATRVAGPSRARASKDPGSSVRDP